MYEVEAIGIQQPMPWLALLVLEWERVLVWLLQQQERNLEQLHEAQLRAQPMFS